MDAARQAKLDAEAAEIVDFFARKNGVSTEQAVRMIVAHVEEYKQSRERLVTFLKSHGLDESQIQPEVNKLTPALIALGFGQTLQ